MKSNKDFPVTQEGLKKIEDTLEDLKKNGRREIAERIKEARDWGDLSENAEYDAAKNDQAMLESKIATLEEQLRCAVLIDPTKVDSDAVSLGSTVHLKESKGDKSFKYLIVGPAEASPVEGKLSNESPVGQAIMGKKRGEIISVKLPKGTRKLKITKIA